MSLTALDALRDAFAELRLAMDGDDLIDISAATARVRDATAQVRATGAWRDEPRLRQKLSDLAPQIESARIRAHVVSDQARQRIGLLAERGVATASLTYER